MLRWRKWGGRLVPRTSVSLRLAMVLLVATCAQMVWRGLDTGQDGWIVGAGALFFGVLTAMGNLLYLLRD